MSNGKYRTVLPFPNELSHLCTPPDHTWDQAVYKSKGWVAVKKERKRERKEIGVYYLFNSSFGTTPRLASTLSASVVPSSILLLCPARHSEPSMSVTNSSAYRSERSFHQTSSSSSSSGNPYMEKSRGLFTEDFGSFMRPGSETLGFSSKLELVISGFRYH